jgi:hypothetical protein
MTALIDKFGVYLFVGVPMLCYAAQGVLVYMKQGRYGMAMAMFGYVAANVGIIMDAKGI